MSAGPTPYLEGNAIIHAQRVTQDEEGAEEDLAATLAEMLPGELERLRVAAAELERAIQEAQHPGVRYRRF